MAATVSAVEVDPAIAKRDYRTQVQKISDAIEKGEGDFYFFVGENKRKFGGITCFLKCLSPGLGKIIADAEAEGKDHAFIEKDDEKLFGLLLKAICTHKWTERKEDAIPLMVLAEKYEAKFVVDLCVKYLDETGITTENAVTIFQDSQFLGVKKYNEAAWEFILKNTEAVVDSEDFQLMTKQNLEKLISENHVSGIEGKLVKALKRVLPKKS